MRPCPGNWVAIGRTVVYYALAAHTFSAGITCQHCMCVIHDRYMIPIDQSSRITAEQMIRYDTIILILTLSMLRLLTSKSQGHKDF